MSSNRGKDLTTMVMENAEAMPNEPTLISMISIKPEEEKEDMSWKKMQNMYVDSLDCIHCLASATQTLN